MHGAFYLRNTDSHQKDKTALLFAVAACRVGTNAQTMDLMMIMIEKPKKAMMKRKDC